ncbi:MAG TPA: hypothetical protein VL137_11880, partial [Polyangiaceae bacterium]|nr:hypothetical protein [Polyangiaceae bacterium]
SLKCGALADCIKECEKPRGVGPCAGVFENFLLCALKQPAKHFECMAMPTPGISDPYCGPEQGAMLSCMRSAPR